MVSLVKQMISKDEKVMVSSRLVAERFEKEHRSILRKIQTIGCSPEFALHNFVQTPFQDSQGKTHTEYLLTRDGFSMIAMSLTGEKATKWKEEFINAFNSMEKALRRKTEDLEWKVARLDGKSCRQDLTDVIQEFVDYASSQGSSNCKRYYSNITKMEYKALALVERGEKVHNDFRDTLDKMQLNALCMSEQIARHWIKDGMSRGLHYKEIYQLVKSKVEAYAEVASVTYMVNGEKQVLIG